MVKKKVKKKKKKNLESFKILSPNIIDFKKIKLNPGQIIENTKSKLENYYTNLKKEKEKEKKRLEKKKKLDLKKELIREKRQIQKDLWHHLHYILKTTMKY